MVECKRSIKKCDELWTFCDELRPRQDRQSSASGFIPWSGHNQTTKRPRPNLRTSTLTPIPNERYLRSPQTHFEDLSVRGLSMGLEPRRSTRIRLTKIVPPIGATTRGLAFSLPGLSVGLQPHEKAGPKGPSALPKAGAKPKGEATD